MQFHYTAKSLRGETVQAMIESDSLSAARQALRRDGLFVLSLTARSMDNATEATKTFFPPRKIATADIMMFLSQLTIMLHSGVDLSEALNNVTTQVSNQKLKTILESVSEDVSNGIAFSAALARHPSAFAATISSGVAAGEQSGDLTGVLERLSKLIRNDVKLADTVRSMLMYPLVLCCITTMVLFAMTFFVLPQFAQVFADLDRNAPPLTQALLTFGHELRSHIVLILGMAFALAVIVASARRTDRFQHTRDSIILHFPLIRKSAQALISGRVFRLLGTLLCAGIPLTDCIRLCRRSTRNQLFQKLFGQIEYDVLNGEKLSKALFTASFLPQGAAQMIQTGENSGNLGGVLQTIGEYYEEEGERHLRDMIKLAEPAIIVFLGGVVAVIVLAVLIPLLDVTTMSDV